MFVTAVSSLGLPDAEGTSLLGRTQGARWSFFVFFSAFLFVSWLPVILVAVPPLIDYPNHLARMHILYAWSHNPQLQLNYQIHWVPAPYLAMDLIVPWLNQFVSIYVSGKIFLLLTITVLAVGPIAIHYALFRRLSLWPLTAIVFIYNFDLAYGFVDYLFGAGVWLIISALWISTEGWPSLRRATVFSLLVIPLYFSHAFAFFAYGLTIGAYELGRWLDGADTRSFSTLLRRGAVSGLQFLIPMFLLGFVVGGQRGVTNFGSINDKLIELISPTFFLGSEFDGALLVFTVAALFFGFAIKGLRLHPAMLLPIIAITGASVVMPTFLSGVYGMDLRLPPMLAMLVISSSQFDLRRKSLSRAVLLISGVLYGAHLTTIYLSWRPQDSDYKEFRSSLGTIERGARVIAFLDSDARRQPSYWHIASLAAIERDAFVPTLFRPPWLPVQSSVRNQNLEPTTRAFISTNDMWEGLSIRQSKVPGESGDSGSRDFWVDWPTRFDYAIGIGVNTRSVLPHQLHELYRGSFFVIYKIESERV